MATGKRFYWIKLKDSFMTSEKVDFLMSQKDGANYVVLYQMLCLKTINTGGELSRTIGEIIVPFEEEKIQRDCKWFTIDTIRVALNLYKRMGMIYEGSDGFLQIAEFENIVGSETDYAYQKKLQRNPEKRMDITMDSGVDIVHTDIRDKILDNRDKIKEKDTENKEHKEGNFPAEPESFSQKNSNIKNLKILLKDDEYFTTYPDLETAINNWMEYKDCKKPKSTHHYDSEVGIRTLLNKLKSANDTYGQKEVCRVINDSISSNYSGIVWDRLNEGKKSSRNSVNEWIDAGRSIEEERNGRF